jgi:predicted DNA-binding transcriptional regulator AlpA
MSTDRTDLGHASNVEDSRIQRLPMYLDLAGLSGDVLRLKRTATYVVISRPDFPAPFRVGGRHRLWMTAEVLAWVDRQPRVHGRPMPQSLARSRRYRDGRLVGDSEV